MKERVLKETVQRGHLRITRTLTEDKEPEPEPEVDLDEAGYGSPEEWVMKMAHSRKGGWLAVSGLTGARGGGSPHSWADIEKAVKALAKKGKVVIEKPKKGMGGDFRFRMKDYKGPFPARI